MHRPAGPARSYWICFLIALLALAPLAAQLGSPSAAYAADPGTVVAWGDNSFGLSAVPAGLANVTAIAAGDYHSLALKSDGTVVAWGWNVAGQTNVPAGLANVTAIVGGGYHNLALKSDGTVVAWGYNAHGQTTVPADLANVTAIAGGDSHSLALKSDGTVVGWGDNSYGQISVPAGLTDVTAIAAGGEHSLALKADGTVVAWGYNAYDQTNVPAGLANVTAIAAGINHSLALKSDGTVVAWGYNLFDQISVPAGLANVTAIAAGGDQNLALKSDGTVVGWGNNLHGQITIPVGLTNVTAMATNGDHSLAIASLPPAITFNPTNQTVLAGQTATFTAAASGTPGPTVQWQANYDGGTTWVDVPGATSTTLTFATALTGEGSGAQFRAIFTNVGGSVPTAAATLTIITDTTPPVISASVVGPLGSNGWYVDNVTLTWTVSDPESIPTTTGCATQNITADTTGTTFTCSATSAGGTSSTPITIKRDATKPTLSPIVAPNPASLNLPATASPNATDATSGVAGQSCAQPDTTSTGAKSVSCTATDNAGNTTAANAPYTVVNDPPTLAVAPGGTCADGTPSGSINLTVGDINTGATGLTLWLVSNTNTQLIPNSKVLFGGSGANRTLTVTAAAKKSGTARLTLRVSDGLNTTDLPVTVIVGTDKNETLNGTAGTDLMFGLSGRNTLNGLGSIDLLCGGNGSDTLNGGDGADTLGGNRGDDKLYGGPGDDTLTGGRGADFFSGGEGTDTATDFTPSQCDKQDGTVETASLAAAAAATAPDTNQPEIVDQIFLPAVQH